MNLAELAGLSGREVAVTDWLEITQQRINQFADATDDHQWIHIDPQRAERESPYGATIAHGFLTLSLLPRFLMDGVSSSAVTQAGLRPLDLTPISRSAAFHDHVGRPLVVHALRGYAAAFVCIGHKGTGTTFTTEGRSTNGVLFLLIRSC